MFARLAVPRVSVAAFRPAASIRPLALPLAPPSVHAVHAPTAQFRPFHTGSVAFAEAETEAAKQLKLQFATPYETLFDNEPIKMVTMPGSDGVMGVLVGHVPIVTALAPGVVKVETEDGDPQSFFVPSGFAIVDEDSKCTISVTEAVRVEDLDKELVAKNLDEHKAALAKADDPAEKAKAQIGVDVVSQLKTLVE